MQVFSHQVARWVRPARLAVASIPLIVSAALGQAPVVPASAPAVVAARTPLDATLIDVAPVIDGVLDDAAWTGTPLPTRDEWRSYNPLHGDAIPKQTTVWVTYDDKALYIAFRCDDPEPAGIKTSVTRRDSRRTGPPDDGTRQPPGTSRPTGRW